jgi:glycosyltransferase involved in cell wall biosynthesis
MSNFESLTIFYPMWNEEDTIERAVNAAFEAGDALVAEGEISSYDVLIIDDASTDRTPELADALAASDPRVSVVHHPTNRKLGGSLKSGFANATGECQHIQAANAGAECTDLAYHAVRKQVSGKACSLRR